MLQLISCGLYLAEAAGEVCGGEVVIRLIYLPRQIRPSNLKVVVFVFEQPVKTAIAPGSRAVGDNHVLAGIVADVIFDQVVPVDDSGFAFGDVKQVFIQITKFIKVIYVDFPETCNCQDFLYKGMGTVAPFQQVLSA
jgi:hypothetical protein